VRGPINNTQLKFAAKLLLLAVLAFYTAGCGTFMAHTLTYAPNRYPNWFASEAPVMLNFNPRLLTNFPSHVVEVGPPPAKLRYRLIPPANYQMQVISSNWLDNGEKKYLFTFKAKLPSPTNAPAITPRGTVILLHGYGLAQFSMLPWALYLAQGGWQCVLVDLRGHGLSTGDHVYYGCVETNDLTQLLNQLARKNQLSTPVDVVGESYGAALALRWKTVEPRVDSVVAIAPYANLSNAVMNIRSSYAGFVPQSFVRAGIKKLPSVLGTSPPELDTTTVLKRHPFPALFVAGADDDIAPPAEVHELYLLAAPGSKYLVVPGATHEALTYYFSDLLTPVVAWLTGGK
jgi:pimeloyl-ACP methyl ester carboxylesterase